MNRWTNFQEVPAVGNSAHFAVREIKHDRANAGGWHFVTKEDGSFQLTFNAPVSQPCEVIATTDLTLPMSSWTALTTGTYGGNPAIYTDTRATNPPAQFYRIVPPPIKIPPSTPQDSWRLVGCVSKEPDVVRSIPQKSCQRGKTVKRQKRMSRSKMSFHFLFHQLVTEPMASASWFDCPGILLAGPLN